MTDLGQDISHLLDGEILLRSDMGLCKLSML
jgi:hypothetical protein